MISFPHLHVNTFEKKKSFSEFFFFAKNFSEIFSDGGSLE
jgi:hypothetical protein